MAHSLLPGAAEAPTKSSEREPVLRRAEVADLGKLARVLAEAFYDDPVFGWLIPADRTRLRSLQRFFTIQLRVLGVKQGAVWTAENLAGCAISTPPRRWRLMPKTLLAEGAGLTRVFGARLPRAGAYLHTVESHHLREPHHYVAYMGVSPQQQGKGIGARLLSPTLDLCDTERLPAYIEATTERSAALYERLGFVLTGELAPRGSPPLRLLVRQPIPREDSR
jgi:GNAT superfamily N-acetyltransferase